MIEFNPYYRFTAEMCIKHPYFDAIRNKELESVCESAVNINVETKFSDVLISMIGEYIG